MEILGEYMITLRELYGIIYGNIKMYVYQDDYAYEDGTLTDADLLFVVTGDFSPDMYLKDKYSKARVKEMSIYDGEIIRVLIETGD